MMTRLYHVPASRLDQERTSLVRWLSDEGWIKKRGIQRTNSTHVEQLPSMHWLNRLLSRCQIRCQRDGLSVLADGLKNSACQQQKITRSSPATVKPISPFASDFKIVVSVLAEACVPARQQPPHAHHLSQAKFEILQEARKLQQTETFRQRHGIRSASKDPFPSRSSVGITSYMVPWFPENRFRSSVHGGGDQRNSYRCFFWKKGLPPKRAPLILRHLLPKESYPDDLPDGINSDDS